MLDSFLYLSRASPMPDKIEKHCQLFLQSNTSTMTETAMLESVQGLKKDMF
jgi:hypothetical protein